MSNVHPLVIVKEMTSDIIFELKKKHQITRIYEGTFWIHTGGRKAIRIGISQHGLEVWFHYIDGSGCTKVESMDAKIEMCDPEYNFEFFIDHIAKVVRECKLK